VLPQGIPANDLLEWMQFGPKQGIEGDIADYVERKKATEADRDGTLEEHYGYPRPFTRSPSSSQIEDIHSKLRNHWDGELPSVLDPTAGGGVIPYESLRYGLPTEANELNPVPSLILKVMLEFAPEVGDISDTVEKWGAEVNSRARSEYEEYFRNAEGSDEISNYISTYTVKCQSCGADIPLVPKWRIRSQANGNLVVVRPDVKEDGSIDYELITSPTEEELNGFDPNDGPVSRGGDAECLNCQVVTESSEVRSRCVDRQFEYESFCVRTINANGGYSLRGPTESDKEILRQVEEFVEAE